MPRKKDTGTPDPLKTTGFVTISRQHSSTTHTSCIAIEITDGTSRTLVAECLLGLEAFALALTGRGDVPATLTVFRGAPWGLTHEHKTEPVLVPEPSRYRFTPGGGLDRAQWDTALTRALATYTGDGWTADRRDVENHHRRLRWDPKTAQLRQAGGHPLDGARYDRQTIYARPPDGWSYCLVSFHRYVQPAPRDTLPATIP